MPARSLSWFLAVGLALAPFAPASAEPVAAKGPQPRLDLNGDPLPPGAVARLGAARLCQQGVLFLAFSPDDKVVAALDYTCLRLWDVQTGKELRHFDDPFVRASPVPNVPLAFSADGKLVALIGGNNTVHVWDVAGGRERFTFHGLAIPPSNLAFDPKGRCLAAGGNGGPIFLWDLEAEKASPACDAVAQLNAMAFSADGTRLIVAAVVRKLPTDAPAERFFHIDVGESKVVREITPSFDDEYHGATAPDGTLFAAPTKDGKVIRLLDASTGKELHRTEGRADHLDQVCFSGDGRFLTASSGDGTVRVWDASTGKVVHELKALSTRVEHVALSHDGKRLALAGPADEAIHLWDVENSKEMHAFAGHRSGPLSVVFSKDGKSVFTTNREGMYTLPSRPPADWSLREWDPATGKELRSIQEDLKGRVLYADFSRDGRLLAAVTHEGALHLWDVAAGKEVRRWTVPVAVTAAPLTDGGVEKLTRADIREPQFSADGRILLAGGGSDATIHRWDTTKGEELSSMKTPHGAIAAIAQPSPADDKSVLVTEVGQNPSHMTLMDATTGQVLRQLWEGNGQRVAWDLSPDGRTLAASDGSAAMFVEVASARSRGKLENDAGKTANLMFSPDGRFLTVVGDGEVRLWRVPTGGLVARLEGCGGQADCLAFSPDSKRLAVSEGRNTILIYDVDALATANAPPAPPTDKELAGYLDDLSAADGARAYQALGQLAANPDRVVAVVKARWKPAPELDAHRIDQWLADLDDDEFAVREKASEELERHSPKTEEAMRRVLRGAPSAEVQHRIEQIFKDLQTAPTSPPSPELVNLRMVELLETCATSGARDMLKELAKGPADAQLTREARMAFDRMTRRAANPP